MTEETIKNIDMATLAVGKSGEMLRTSGIGSCVVITIYDPVNKVGGLSHAMLPSYAKHCTTDSNKILSKFADTSIEELVRLMVEKGGNKAFFRAKLIGGARMFKLLGGEKNSIGDQNITAAKQKLTEMNIPLESEDTGGTIGRSAEFDISSGIVTVSTKM